MTHHSSKRNKVPKAVLMRSDLVSLTTARPVNTAQPRTTMNSNTQQDLEEKGVIDSGCSRHMTGNMSYLTDFEEIDGGYVAFGATKDETNGILKSFITGVENLIDQRVKVIRCDNGTEFKNKEMNQFYERKCIKREFSVARTPQQNEVAERKNRTLIEAARTMLADFKLPILFGLKQLILLAMCKIGCPIRLLNIIDHLGKFDGKADEGFFVEYSINRSRPNWLFDIDALTKLMNYKLVVAGNQSNGNVGTKSCNDAGKMETVHGKDHILLPLWPTNPLFSQSSKSSLDAKFKPSGDDKKKVTEELGKEDGDLSKEDESNDQEKDDNVNSTNNVNAASTNKVNVIDDDEDVGAEADMNNLNTFMPIIPIPTTRIHKDHPDEQIIRHLNSAPQTRRMTKNLEEHGLFSSEPKKVIHALKDPSWIEAMQDEHLQFKLQKVWTLVDLPNGKRAIGTKWVYRNKKDERGIMIKNKARLVAQWYIQEEGIDYDEMDVKSAFLYDDIIFGSTKKSLCTEFEKMMQNKFQMSSMGELTFFLGLQVKQREDGIFINQDKYVTEILKKFGFTDVKTTSTPMETQKPWLKDEDGEEVDVHLYRSMIGSLMYLTSSIPDIMFIVCACARYQVNPKVSHLYAVKRIFSDYARASLDRKSTIGGCQFIGCRLISWQCKKQTIVANSKTKAEYVAASSCCGQVKTVNGEQQLQALVDAKKIVVTEASVRRDLQLDDEEGHKRIYVTPSHTKKIFANMRRQGKDFYVVSNIIISQQWRPKKKDTQVPQSSVPSDPTNIADEAVNEEPSMQLKELMDLCTKLQQRVLDLENTKTAQAQELTSLKLRVKKLRGMDSPIDESDLSSLSYWRTSLEVEREGNRKGSPSQEDASKQGRKIHDIDVDEDITLENVHDAEMFDVNDLHGDEVFVEKKFLLKNVKPKVTTATTETTKGILLQEPSESITTTITILSKDKGKGILVEEPLKMKKKDQISFDKQEAIRLQAEFDKEVRLAREKDEANVALIKEWNDILAKIDVDYQMAKQMQAEEQEELSIEEKSNLFVQLLEARKKHFAIKRAEEKRNKPSTRAQQRSIITYLKNMVGWKPTDLKNKSFANIKELFDKAFTRVNTFVDFRTELVEGTEMEESSKKAEVMEESSKREATKMKDLMKIIPDEEEVAVDAIPLATKPSSIVDWKIVKEGKISYYQIIRADGSSKRRYSVKESTRKQSVEKRYPLTPATITEMLNKKLQADHCNEMVTPPKKERKFKKHTSPKLTTIPVSPEEPTRKSKRVKSPAKKFTNAPTTGVVIRDTHVISLSKKKEKYKEVRKKSLRDIHKTRPSGFGIVTKLAPSAAKIKPSVTNEGTGAKPGVLDVTEESTKSKVESWGRDEDDNNNDHDSSSEGSDQESDSGDDNTQSDKEKGLDSEHETDENEMGSESDQEENE
ncbi:retrovirus-related pol polyprotein from transposon TNT 1-94 [Tanacetum coccineum]